MGQRIQYFSLFIYRCLSEKMSTLCILDLMQMHSASLWVNQELQIQASIAVKPR